MVIFFVWLEILSAVENTLEVQSLHLPHFAEPDILSLSMSFEMVSFLGRLNATLLAAKTESRLKQIRSLFKMQGQQQTSKPQPFCCSCTATDNSRNSGEAVTEVENHPDEKPNHEQDETDALSLIEDINQGSF